MEKVYIIGAAAIGAALVGTFFWEADKPYKPPVVVAEKAAPEPDEGVVASVTKAIGLTPSEPVPAAPTATVKVDAGALVYASMETVATALGAGKCMPRDYGQYCEYTVAGEDAVVAFAKDKAVFLDLPGYGLEFAPEALAEYKLSLGEPSFAKGDTMRWGDAKVGDVSMSKKKDGTIDYLLIITPDSPI